MGIIKKLFSKKVNLNIDGENIEIIKSQNKNIESDYGLKNLTDGDIQNFSHISEKATVFIKKYYPEYRPEDKFDSRILDLVLDNWKSDNSKIKEDTNKVIETIGYAFGQDIVNNLNFEWKLLTDKYGTDFTVIHEKYRVNGFPFSSVGKEIHNDRKGTLYQIKLLLKKNVDDAEEKGTYEQR